METVAGETPLSSATSRRVTAVLLSFRRVKNGSEIVADRGARRVNIFITGGARRLAVRGGVAGHVCGEASNEAQVRSGESALQSISNMKIAYRTKAWATAQARFSNLGLPFPKTPTLRSRKAPMRECGPRLSEGQETASFRAGFRHCGTGKEENQFQ